MNDEDRWIRGQGPPPPEIRALFDAMHAPRPMSADVPDALTRRVLAAEEAERRREAWARKAKWALAALVALAIGAAGSAGALAWRHAESADVPLAMALARSRAMSKAPPKPRDAEARPVDAGPSGRP